MNIIFWTVVLVVLVIISPALFFIYKGLTNKETRPDSDIARIRFIKEMEMIEGASKWKDRQ